MKPIRNSNLSIVDLVDFRTASINGDGLICSTILAVNNGERLPARIRLYVSSLGQLILEVSLA